MSLDAAIRSAACGELRPELIPPAIRHAKIKPTNNCNSKCITCAYWEHRYENELTLEEVLRLLAELKALGVEDVMFSGGEPTLRKDLVEMVAAAKNIGFSNIGMTTNSLSLIAKLDGLCDAGLGEIVLSLEGLESHDLIRGVLGNTGKVLGALKHLCSRREQGLKIPQIKLAATLMNRNLDEILPLVDLARDHGAGFFLNLIDAGTYFFQGKTESLFIMADLAKLDSLIDRLIDIKRVEPVLISNSIASLDYTKRYFRDPKQAQIPCYLGYVGVDIDSNGDVYSNCWGMAPLGNIRKDSLEGLLSGSAFKRRLGDMYAKRCAGCSCGYILNLSHHPDSAAANPTGAAPTRTGFSGERFTP
ncbi:MAG: radical SAM protein [Alphaproteobacteria bacterium]|nr:radical SAM protein [Alphaproteobacteria bacterium]